MILDHLIDIYLGQTLALLVTASGDYQEVELNSFDLLTSDGSIHQQFNLTKLSDKSYGSIFTPTLEVFQIALTGVDSSGNQVRRISGTGLQVSEVSLKLGKFFESEIQPNSPENCQISALFVIFHR